MNHVSCCILWIPAFAGMTSWVRIPDQVGNEDSELRIILDSCDLACKLRYIIPDDNITAIHALTQTLYIAVRIGF